MYWAKYHLQHLKKWREAVEAIAKAVSEIVPGAEVYVVGGAAENRLTVLSDIDIVVCLGEKVEPDSIWELRRRILATAIDKYGLPWDYPVEIHILTCDVFKDMFRNKKTIRVPP